MRTFENAGNGWYTGRVDDYEIEAKVYDRPSRFGINEGRVSKLYLYMNGAQVWAYDRGYAPNNPSLPEGLEQKIVKELEAL